MKTISTKQMGQLRSALQTQILQMRAGGITASEAGGTIDELKALYVEIGGNAVDLDCTF